MPTKIVTHMFTPQSTIADGVRATVRLMSEPDPGEMSPAATSTKRKKLARCPMPTTSGRVPDCGPSLSSSPPIAPTSRPIGNTPDTSPNATAHHPHSHTAKHSATASAMTVGFLCQARRAPARGRHLRVGRGARGRGGREVLLQLDAERIVARVQGRRVGCARASASSSGVGEPGCRSAWCTAPRRGAGFRADTSKPGGAGPR